MILYTFLSKPFDLILSIDKESVLCTNSPLSLRVDVMLSFQEVCLLPWGLFPPAPCTGVGPHRSCNLQDQSGVFQTICLAGCTSNPCRIVAFLILSLLVLPVIFLKKLISVQWMWLWLFSVRAKCSQLYICKRWYVVLKMVTFFLLAGVHLAQNPPVDCLIEFANSCYPWLQLFLALSVWANHHTQILETVDLLQLLAVVVVILPSYNHGIGFVSINFEASGCQLFCPVRGCQKSHCR